MKFVTTLALLFSLSIPCLAQQQVLPPKRNYTVTEYKLQLDWRNVFRNKTQKFVGVNTISFNASDTVSVIALDASDLRIDSVFMDGMKILPTPKVVADTLTVPVKPTENFAHVATIYYARALAANDGMYFYPQHTYAGYNQSTNDSIYTAQDVAYTMSEPLDAHKWMPCNDQPYDKVKSSISIIVPNGYSAQSNGTLVSVDTGSDQSHRYNWVSDRPIATYLMVADASVWKTWRDEYHRLSNPNDSVPVIYYCWPEDDTTSRTDGRFYNAHYAFRNTPKMLETYSRLFGEYPFVSYSQIPVQPFAFGGMEHQTITTDTRTWLRGGDEDGIAHELMHQWFGDKVTCETWADIWLNEGFATMGEWVWEEATYGVAAGNNAIKAQAQRFFNPYTQYGETNTIPTYNPPIDNVFNVQTTYMKPGLVLYMLRRALDDDSTFFGTLRNYNDAFAYSTCNTFQFRDYLEQHIASTLPVDPAEFINEWIFRPDYPKYTITWNQRADNTLYVKVDQAPDSSDHYTMPLRFLAISGQDTAKLMFVNDKRSQIFSTHLDHKINDLAFDQMATIVSTFTIQHDTQLAGVNADASAERYLRASNTSNGMRISFEPAVGPSARVELLDVLGRTLYVQPLAAGSTMTTLNSPTHSAGSYFVRLADGDSQQITRVQLP
jgi:aminopeptidase N